jgi:hypothetical protein
MPINTRHERPAISFEAWVKFVFDHPVDQGDSWYWAEELEVPDLELSQVLEYFARLCRTFKSATQAYSAAQIDQGVWFLLGDFYSMSECLTNATHKASRHLEKEKRSALRSIYYVYAEYVAVTLEPEEQTSFYMWWDEICHQFWSHCRSVRRSPIADEDMPLLIEEASAWVKVDSNILYSDASQEEIDNHLRDCGIDPDEPEDEPELKYTELTLVEKELLDGIFDVLLQILDIDNHYCQISALHGIAHSDHPKRRATVEAYIEKYADVIPHDELPWVKACADGKVI